MRIPKPAVLLAAAISLAVFGGAAAMGTSRPPAKGGPVTFQDYPTGFTGGEPTLGVLKDGCIVTQAYLVVAKSCNGGQSWEDTHRPPLNASLDPYIHVDSETNRIFSSQLLGACQEMSISDDEGETWTELASQCGTGDHQKLGSGPWHDPANKLYPRSVYTCVNHILQTACAVSIDGGIAWGPLVTVFPGYDPSAEEGLDAPGFCGGLEGDPASGPDGTLYVPREYCGRPFLGVSKDDGLTWTRHYVSEPAQTRPIAWGANNPSVTTTGDGTVYYAWTGDDWKHYVARSTDQGETWSKPWTISTPDIMTTTFPAIIGGRKGAVATSFIGTREANANPGDVPPESKWYLFISYSFNAHAKSAKWKTVQVTDHPIEIGCVGRHGGEKGCGNGNLLDFNDMAFTPQGRLAVSYTDGCVDRAEVKCDRAETSNSEIVSVVVQTGGPSFTR